MPDRLTTGRQLVHGFAHHLHQVVCPGKVRTMTKKEILDIKDPVAQRKAIAANLDLF